MKIVGEDVLEYGRHGLHYLNGEPFTGIEDGEGYHIYYKYGKFHREDGPALEWWDGEKAWWVNGERHRTDGPAIIWSSGGVEWWVNDQWYRTFDEWIKYLSEIDLEHATMMKLKWG